MTSFLCFTISDLLKKIFKALWFSEVISQNRLRYNVLFCYLHSFSCCLLIIAPGSRSPLRSLYVLLLCVSNVYVLFVLTASRQLLAPGYQEIWFSPDGARRSASPASTVSLKKQFYAPKSHRKNVTAHF